MSPALRELNLPDLELGEEYEICKGCLRVRKSGYGEGRRRREELLPEGLEHMVAGERLSRYSQELLEDHHRDGPEAELTVTYVEPTTYRCRR
jgi:hypothetical protein